MRIFQYWIVFPLNNKTFIYTPITFDRMFIVRDVETQRQVIGEYVYIVKFINLYTKSL